MLRSDSCQLARLLLPLCALAPTAALAAPRELALTPLTWSLLGGVALVAVLLAVVSLWRDRDSRVNDDAPLGRYVGPADESPRADEATMELPAAIRTRRSGMPLDAQPLPELAPIASPVPLQAAAGTDPELARIVGIARAAPAAAAGAQPPDQVGAPPDGMQPFLALHHVDLSIDVLRRHLAAEARPMPAVWVMLLDLSRTHGREQVFREIAAEFHHRFNVCAPSWDGYPPDRSEPGLEAYPRIVRELTQTWGTHECRRLLDRLLYDNRRGGRRGFTMNAYNDLIALRRAAGVVLETIEQDYAEESKVRGAYRQAAVENDAADEPAPPTAASPLVRDLESQLDADLSEHDDARSALEQEHPALADALAREWGNAALASRLGEMLSRGTEGVQLSGQAQDDVELLRSMAQRLAEVNRITLAAD